MSVSFEILQGKISEAIEHELNRVKERVIETAKKEFEQELRRVMALAVIKVQDVASFERIGPNLVITVRIEEPKK